MKQLLYREEPNKTPGSRFRRIERFAWFRELALATLAGIVTTVIFFLTGWTQKIAIEVTAAFNFEHWIHLAILFLATCLTITLRLLLHGRVHIHKLSAGSATVTLDDKATSYFDQYLDEIVYFFEVSKRNIVIFEDIDRFNDSLIFETLRSLNTLLNNSPQIHNPIHFIYAIKDSIFDRIGLELEGRKFEPNLRSIQDAAHAEIVRANRTKFFDLVIPVVPFITHQSARNLTTQLLQGIQHEISPALIDLSCQYIPDMRLLKNVRNEFVVFRDRIFSGEGQNLGLNETDLFAMMLYKSTHLTDFEAIRIRKSNLDEIYEAGRRIVACNLSQIEQDVRSIRRRLTHLDQFTKHSSRLGELLIEHVERTARAANFSQHNKKYEFEGRAWTEDDLCDTKFWKELAHAAEDSKLVWSNSHRQRLSFPRSDLSKVLDIRLAPKYWNEAEREELVATLSEKNKHLKFLRSADIGDLIKRPEFLVEHDNGKKSLHEFTQERLTLGLAYNLIRAGYINRNFTLYTSTFHGDRVSPAAMNFIIHHVERDVMDEHFQLNRSDVEAVIRECGKNALKDSALYNISILDHLLRNDTNTADIMIQSLVTYGDIQNRFMQAYLNSASERFRFVQSLAKTSSRTFLYLINQVDLVEPDRLNLISAALVSRTVNSHQ